MTDRQQQQGQTRGNYRWDRSDTSTRLSILHTPHCRHRTLLPPVNARGVGGDLRVQSTFSAGDCAISCCLFCGVDSVVMLCGVRVARSSGSLLQSVSASVSTSGGRGAQAVFEPLTARWSSNTRRRPVVNLSRSRFRCDMLCVSVSVCL